MKFPKKLSKERLSLLSPEDRKIYEYEHSGLCPEMKKLYESEEVDDEELTFEEVRDFELDNEYTEEEKREIKRIFDEMLFES